MDIDPEDVYDEEDDFEEFDDLDDDDDFDGEEFDDYAYDSSYDHDEYVNGMPGDVLADIDELPEYDNQGNPSDHPYWWDD